MTLKLISQIFPDQCTISNTGDKTELCGSCKSHRREQSIRDGFHRDMAHFKRDQERYGRNSIWRNDMLIWTHRSGKQPTPNTSHHLHHSRCRLNHHDLLPGFLQQPFHWVPRLYSFILFSTNVNHFILLSVWKNHQLYQGKKQRLYLPWATNWACSTSWLPLRPHFLNANLADPQICPAHGISLCLPRVFSTQDPFPLDSQMACFIPPFSLCSPKLSILTSWNNWVSSHSLAPSLLYVSS